MKQLSILFFVFLCFSNTQAQDTITLKNGKVIHAYITEKNDSKIKYQIDSIDKADSTKSMNLLQIREIQYENGEVDLLSSQNPRSIYPLGVNCGFMFVNIPGMLTCSIDYLITPNISAELNFRYLPRSWPWYLFSLGGKYWFTNKYSKSGFSPFAGLYYSKLWMKNDYEDIMWFHKPEWSVYNQLEVPVGISYITRFGLQTSLQSDNYISFESNKLNIFSNIELRIGWRFKTGKKGY